MKLPTREDEDSILLRLYSNGMVYGLFGRMKENEKEPLAPPPQQQQQPIVECLLSSSGRYFSIYSPSVGNITKNEKNITIKNDKMDYRNILSSMKIQTNEEVMEKEEKEWKQRTTYCWTPYRDYVIEMLRFRNMYYPKPYMAAGWLEFYYPILKVRVYIIHIRRSRISAYVYMHMYVDRGFGGSATDVLEGAEDVVHISSSYLSMESIMKLSNEYTGV